MAAAQRLCGAESGLQGAGGVEILTGKWTQFFLHLT
jgi:hypothetical protein